MYHSNIHSEHGGSSNHSSRSGHHEWLSSILLSSGEGALSPIGFIIGPLGGASSHLLASSSCNEGSCGVSGRIFILAGRIQECLDFVSGGSACTISPSFSSLCSGCNSVCGCCGASVGHCFVKLLCSVVALSLGLFNFLSISTGGFVEFVVALEIVLKNGACSVGGGRNVSARSKVSSGVELGVSGSTCTSVTAKGTSSINVWHSCFKAVGITVDNFCLSCGCIRCIASSHTNSTSRIYAVWQVELVLVYILFWEVTRVCCACSKRCWTCSSCSKCFTCWLSQLNCSICCGCCTKCGSSVLQSTVPESRGAWITSSIGRALG